MQNLLFYSAFTLLLFAACTNETELTSKTESEVGEKELIYSSKLKVNIKQSSNMLAFDNLDELESLASKFKSYSIKDNNTTKSKQSSNDYTQMSMVAMPDISLKEDGFHSIYDDYINAMNEAESYYDRPGGYEEFKEKYPMLYFPEEGGDYSVYLPVSDKNIAKLLNSDGEVVIGGEIVNLIDLNSYEELVNLGLTPPAEENHADLTTKNIYPLNHLPTKYCNSRKLWINTRVRPGTSPGVLEEIVIEVCFRKKGFLGKWYNYNSDTTLAWASGAIYRKSGNSSHDYKWAREYGNNGKFPFVGLMYVQFRGFGGDCGSTKYYFNMNL